MSGKIPVPTGITNAGMHTGTTIFRVVAIEYAPIQSKLLTINLTQQRKHGIMQHSTFVKGCEFGAELQDNEFLFLNLAGINVSVTLEEWNALKDMVDKTQKDLEVRYDNRK